MPRESQSVDCSIRSCMFDSKNNLDFKPNLNISSMFHRLKLAQHTELPFSKSGGPTKHQHWWVWIFDNNKNSMWETGMNETSHLIQQKNHTHSQTHTRRIQRLRNMFFFYLLKLVENMLTLCTQEMNVPQLSSFAVAYSYI